MLGRATAVAAGAAAVLAFGAATAGAATPIVSSSAADVDYHAEGQIIGGNIHVQTDRAPAKGVAVPDCDPDPRPAPHARPDGCAFAVPAGSGRDLVSFGRHIADADVSPAGAFTPFGTASREHFNGKAGFDNGGPVFVGDFFDDDDMHVRLTPRTLDAYLAPNGDANNRWRRFCGTGLVEQFDNSGHGGAYAHPPLAPFAPGQVRKFVVEVWDADFREPSDRDGGNQDYWVIDILKPGSYFDVSRCKNPVPAGEKPGPGPGPGPAAPPTEVTRPGVTPQALTPTSGSLPPLVLGSSAPSVRVSGAIRGPGGCVNQSFKLAVAGANILRVDFSLDGRFVRRVTRRDSSGFFRTTISLRGLARTTHRARARVVFRRGTGAAPRTLSTTFRLCPRPVARPAFTG